MKFRDDYGVYVCPHVFDGSRPVLDSCRDTDGSWQFLCGVQECMENSEPRFIGVGHLIKRDESINDLTVLEPGTYAERKSINAEWTFGKLED
ncbi:hypothetical protein P3339_17185 [Microbulbifer sp. MLAF003]|uniref:hypothetical protein n=1 Tax=Microbulbifer TaxID=48073 RepID=UPI00035D3901|nr:MULTISPECIES: hypothetical protein [Microbulbifer]WHI50165.1 hypothetical protein P3339_17185 [Microbulbifer sp. MLAF003]